MPNWYLGAQCAKANIPHTIGPPPPAWIFNVFMLLRPNTDPAILSHLTRSCFSNLRMFSYGEPVPNVVSDSCARLTGVEPGVVICCCSPFASWLAMLCVLKCFSILGLLSVWSFCVCSSSSFLPPRKTISQFFKIEMPPRYRLMHGYVCTMHCNRLLSHTRCIPTSCPLFLRVIATLSRMKQLQKQ